MMGDHGGVLTYKKLRGELQKCFGLEGHVGQYWTQLKERRRQKGESLRALYQDISHLALLAFPGPQNELKDRLSVDAFVDSLNDYELKRSVKDRFPKDLASAFQIALDLEANRKSLHNEEERRDKGKHYRTDVEARVVSQEVNVLERMDAMERRLVENFSKNTRPDVESRVVAREPEWKEVVGVIQKGFMENQAEVRRIVENNRKERRKVDGIRDQNEGNSVAGYG